MAEKPQKNSKQRQRIVLKGLVKQRKHYLSLARKSFKKQENIKRKREAANILQKPEPFGQNAKVGIPAVCFRTILVIKFHNLYQSFRKVVFNYGAAKQKIFGISILKRLPS